MGVNAFEHPAEALGAEGLEQVVDRAELERGDGEAVVCGGENEGGPVPDALDDLEARHLRQSDVQEQQLRREIIDETHRLRAIDRFADDLDPVYGLQVLAKSAARLGFVFGNHRPHRPHRHRTTSSVWPSIGMSMVARRPRPSKGSSDNWARPA